MQEDGVLDRTDIPQQAVVNEVLAVKDKAPLSSTGNHSSETETCVQTASPTIPSLQVKGQESSSDSGVQSTGDDLSPGFAVGAPPGDATASGQIRGNTVFYEIGS